MARKRISRRKFVGDVAAGISFTIVPRHVLGHGLRAPSDKLNIACIGCGGKGRSDIDGVAGENIYSLCDVDWSMALDAFQSFPKAKRFRDYREMLDKEEEHRRGDSLDPGPLSHAPRGSRREARQARVHPEAAGTYRGRGARAGPGGEAVHGRDPDG
jgi:hypothetical protein